MVGGLDLHLAAYLVVPVQQDVPDRGDLLKHHSLEGLLRQLANDLDQLLVKVPFLLRVELNAAALPLSVQGREGLMIVLLAFADADDFAPFEPVPVEYLV